MKKQLLTFAICIVSGFAFAQTENPWSSITSKGNSGIFENKLSIKNPKLYNLNVGRLKEKLKNVPKKLAPGEKSEIIISFPNSEGSFENFKISEISNFDSALAAKYPDIKSYVGQSLENSVNTIYFSLSPLGLSSMEIYENRSAVFIEPYSKDLSSYIVYKKADKKDDFSKFECSVLDVAQNGAEHSTYNKNANDATLRTFRLALSCTGEYAQYFGGTKALALAAMNNTMTRVNGVFEKDFASRMVLISNNDAVIYTNSSTDPYSNASSMSNWNSELQSTLTSVIGEANYDIGHLFGASGGGGNAGCIGCICTNGSKGSGYTSPADAIPSGDNFDIDYVAHEMGHQYGANHTFSMSNEGTGVNMEPGSGSTIMGYAGITSYDIQPHSDAFFHAISIQQVTNNIKAKTCSVNTATGNSIPTANAGLDYTIPKSTPFMLTGTGTDADGDTLTYIWEEIDNATSSLTGANSAAKATKTAGPNFRSWTPSLSPTRYFPKMESVLAGATTTAGSEIAVEALSSVARTLNFRFTVRDNKTGGSGNNSDDVIITVNSTAGPFAITSQSSATTYSGGSSQTVTWNVSGTTANNINCANVDILWSTDGSIWTTLLASTPNDGSQAITIPNSATTTGRIMVKGTNHIFFDVNNANITVTASSSDTSVPTAPTLSAAGTTQNSTTLSWSGATDNVAVTGYDVYNGSTLLTSTTSTSYTVTGLSASTTYTFTVKAKDAAGNTSVDSNSVSVTTLAPVADITAPTAPTLTASSTTSSTTSLSWSGATDDIAVTGYDVYNGSTLLTSTTSTSYTVTGLSASTTYTFTVKAKDAAGNTSVDSNSVSITTLTNTVTYCTSSGNSTSDERIGTVKFGTINNTSTGTSGYEDFTTLSSNVTRGTAYTITITPYWTSTKYKEAYAVYIDYNQDGDFADSGETVWTKSASTTTPVTGSITIPTSATLGSTRMRVIMKYNALPTSSCGTFSYGQVEDYSLNIISAAKPESSNIKTISDLKIYPNPVKDILNISDTESKEYKIYDISGKLVSTGKFQNGNINVNHLNKGIYMIQIGSITKKFIKE